MKCNNIYMDIALSDSEVLRLVHGQANIVMYPDLHNYSSLDDVFGPFNACFILFESRPRYGHWTCLIRSGLDVEFFNPYGGWPDDSLEFIPMEFRKRSYQYKPYLSMLLLDSPYTLYYNEFDFQSHRAGVRTCGRHCAVRILEKNLDIYEYKNYLDRVIMENGLRNYDAAVVFLTQKI